MNALDTRVLVRGQYRRLMASIQLAEDYLSLEEVQRAIGLVTPLWEAADCRHLLGALKLAVRRRASRLVLREGSESVITSRQPGLYDIGQHQVHRLSLLVGVN